MEIVLWIREYCCQNSIYSNLSEDKELRMDIIGMIADPSDEIIFLDK